MNKWYQSRVCKGILIGLAHVAIVIAVVSFVQLFEYHNVSFDVLLGSSGAEEYEDTEGFEQEVQDMSHDALYAVKHQQILETDGKYNPDKMVNIMTDEVAEKIPEDDNGIWYRLGDLIEWGEGNIYDSSISFIVCEKPDGTYDYYKNNEFNRLIAAGELKSVDNQEEVAAEAESVMSSDEAYGEYMYYGGELLNQEGDTAYVNYWEFYSSIGEEYLKVRDADLLSIVNSKTEWNGRLQEIIDMLESSIWEYYDYYTSYINGYDYLQEGNSNFAFLLVDTEAGKIYTNRQAYADYGAYERNIEEMANSGKYVVVSPILADFDTNIAAANASTWQQRMKATEFNDYVYAAAVDTTYPVQDVYYSYHQIYQKYNPVVAVGSLLVFILAVIWLTAIAGRTRTEEGLVLNKFDKWKTELAAALIIAAWVFMMWFIIETGPFTGTNSSDRAAAAIMGVITCALFLAGYLSLVRRIKAGTVWSNSILRWLWGHVGMVWEFIRAVFRSWHSTWKLLTLGAGFIVIHWIALGSFSAFPVFLALVLEAAAFIYLIREAMSRQKVRTGLRRIAEGEINYQIPVNRLVGEYKEIAERINRIGEGLDAAVEKSMRDERLKTDLITNVSHDIKTPLTSIINYVDLLKRENFKDPKIKNYLNVLESKAQRLKALTEDVVEASKVSSGNVNLEFMNVDLVEMLYQANGEFAERFSEKGLQVIMKLPEDPVLIRVDGRRMWRVLENIFNNAAKYAMNGTRIYGDMYIENGEVIFSMKNISANELNISPDELTERFIRGDDSRTTEGSGLGLSIAKSLTELQGGQFKIVIDGDLFKVILRFSRASEQRNTP